MPQKIVLLESAVSSARDAFRDATQELHAGLDNLQTSDQQVQDAIDEALTQSDVDPDYVSYDGTLPPVGPDGTIGAYFDENGNLQKLESDGISWTEIGEPLINKSAFNSFQRSEQDIAVDFDFDISDYENTQKKLLSISTYVTGNDEVVHPAVHYFPNKWNGWKYWMVITPYPNSDNSFENPSLYVSNDGIDWSVPSGVSNPIIPAPSSGYNSDPELCFLNGRLYLLYRLVQNGDKFLLSSSIDGVNWSSPEVVLTENDTGERMMSPSVLINSDGIHIYYFQVGDPNEVRYIKCDYDFQNFGSPVSTNIAPPSTDLRPWHGKARFISGKVLMLYNAPPSTSNQGDIYAAVSNSDYVTFDNIADRIVTRSGQSFDNGSYRGDFWPSVKDGELIIKYWDGVKGGSGWQLAYTDLKTKSSLTTNRFDLRKWNNYLFVNRAIAPWQYGDNFERADATNAGISSGGTQSWTQVSGSIGIENYLGVATGSGSNHIATLGAGYGDIVIEANIQRHLAEFLGNQIWLLVRFADSSNFIRVGFINNTLRFQVISSGSITTDEKFNDKIKSGDYQLRVEESGDVFSVYLNGVKKGEITETALSTNTTPGLQINNKDVRVSSFSVGDLSTV